MNDLIENIEKLHTTKMGEVRIKRNLDIETDDIVGWCKMRILDADVTVDRTGKNWYVSVDGCILTVNAHSYTIITAQKSSNDLMGRIEWQFYREFYRLMIS